MTKDLKEQNLETLLEWCEKYKNLLENIKSNLHFETLKLKVEKIIFKEFYLKSLHFLVYSNF